MKSPFTSIAEAIERVVDYKLDRAGTSEQTVPATYLGTDDQGKAFVRLAGSDESTPVKSMTVQADVGDMVRATVGNGRVVVSANASNPSASTSNVGRVEEQAVVAKETAVQAIDHASEAMAASSAAKASASSAMNAAVTAQQSADSAQADAARAYNAAEGAVSDAARAQDAADAAQEDATAANNSLKSVVSGATTVEKAVSVMQTALEAVVDYDPQEDTVTEYFWHDANGAHVLGDTSGYRNDINSSGMDIKLVSTEDSIAQFGADGARIGIQDSRHSEVTKSRFGFYDLDGNPIFHAGSRDADEVRVVVWRGVTDERKAEIIADLPYLENLRQTDVEAGTDESTATVDGYATVTGANAFRESESMWVGVSIGAGNVAVESFHSETVYYAYSNLTFAWPQPDCEFALITYDHEDYYSFLAFGDSEFFEDKIDTLGGFSTSLGLSASTGFVGMAGGIYSGASGASSFAYGYNANAIGAQSAALGLGTKARGSSQTAIGKYNAEDTGNNYAFVIGNGSSGNDRSDALTVDWIGNVECGTVNGVDMADIVVDSDLTGYAKLTANTFTGTQAHKDGSIDRDGTIAAADDWTDTPLTFQDKNGELIGQIGLVERGTTQTNYDAGSIECMIRAFNENAGTQVENRITAGIARDGSCYYLVSDKAAFRTALSLGAAATMGTGTTASTVALGNHTHSNYYNSSTSRTANTFLAAPNGSNGAATFREIVPADVPTLNQNTTGSAAKLTTARSLYVALGTTYDSASPVTFDGTAAKALPVSGTLGKARGGTGKTNTDTTYYGAKSLFSGTATTGTVTLSETAANYSMLLIQYRDNDSNYSSKLIIGPNGKRVVLDMVYGVSGVGNLKSRTVSISGTSITTVSGSTMDAAHNGGAGTTNHIYITQVWGWK